MRLLFIFFLLVCSCKMETDSKQTNFAIKEIKKIFFKNLNDGDTVLSPFTIEMGVVGMVIQPAGSVQAGTGHHHILINRPFMSYGDIIPMDDQHLHYGKGDTVAEISLPEGKHQLTLQFANGMHMSYGQQFSNSINIYVKQ